MAPTGGDPSGLRVSVEERGDRSVVRVAGEVDLNTAGHLYERLLRVVGGRERPRVVLDASGVSFLDSTGMSVLVKIARDVSAAGGWIRLAGCTPAVSRALAVARLDRRVPIYPTVEAAETD